MRQNPDQEKPPITPADFEEIIGEAEQSFRQGMQTLSDWGDQARHIIKNRPGVVLASVSIAGFMTGLLLRQGRITSGKSQKLSADPMILFLTGAVAGFTMGPRVIREISENLHPDSLADSSPDAMTEQQTTQE
jgi:hypothetical protein